jgi:hypothetical protein
MPAQQQALLYVQYNATPYFNITHIYIFSVIWTDNYLFFKRHWLDNQIAK